MRRLGLIAIALVVAAPLLLGQPARPDTVFFEDLTFDEIRDAIKAGTTNVIIATGGTQDTTPHLVAGAPTDTATSTVDRIARAVGHTLVAPVIGYAPDGLVPVPREKGYEALLESAAESVKASGFKNVFFLGESAATSEVLKSIANRLDIAWQGSGARAFHVSAYGAKARADQDRDTAVDEIRGFLSLPASPSAVAPALAPSASTISPVAPTPVPRTSSGPSLFVEDLTPAEIQAAVASGKKTAIVPTGGTEKNGFHMAVGKHNFHVRAGAELIAKKLGNALVAPVLQYVPEGRATGTNPGVLSCARDCFEPVVESIARGVKALGFTEILLIGDNGGNQAGLRAVAALLNKEWDDSGVKAYALTDFYDKGHEYQDAWFLAQFGWDASVVGSHAGIKDTSQLLYVKPQHVRTDRIADSFGHRQESGVSGDPTKATAEFGRIAIEFKANGAIAQYRALKAQAEGGSGGRAPRRGTRTTGDKVTTR